jgi:Arc/MetJ family transcription regulator
MHAKRTNIVIDADVVAEGKKLTGIRVTRELVDTALRELVRRRRQRAILNLRGRVDWEGDLSAMRRGRLTG